MSSRERTRERRVLRALAACDCELCGLDLVEMEVGHCSWLFAVLARMKKRGWIEGRFEQTDPPLRWLYRITDAGSTALTPVLPAAKVR